MGEVIGPGLNQPGQGPGIVDGPLCIDLLTFAMASRLMDSLQKIEAWIKRAK